MAKAADRPIFPALPCTVSNYFERQAWLHVLWRHAGYSPGVKVIGSALADHLHMATGKLYPALTTLGIETGLTSRAAKKAIDHISEGRMLKRRSGSGRTSSAYTLLIPDIETGTDVPVRLEQTFRSVWNVRAARLELAGIETGTGVPPNLVINHESTFSGSAPRAPDGAAVAAGMGNAGDVLLGRLGAGQMASWFQGARFEGSRLIVSGEFRAKWIREKFPSHMDAAMPGGWTVEADASAEATNAA